MKEETIRETIKHCLNETPEGLIPIPIAYMLRSFALVLYLDASKRIGKEPDDDIINVIADGSCFNPDNMGQFLALQDFLKYWLSKPRHAFCGLDKYIEHFGGNDFSESSALINAWNQYIRECGKT